MCISFPKNQLNITLLKLHCFHVPMNYSTSFGNFQNGKQNFTHFTLHCQSYPFVTVIFSNFHCSYLSRKFIFIYLKNLVKTTNELFHGNVINFSLSFEWKVPVSRLSYFLEGGWVEINLPSIVETWPLPPCRHYSYPDGIVEPKLYIPLEFAPPAAKEKRHQKYEM